jgi:hypothetical protein
MRSQRRLCSTNLRLDRRIFTPQAQGDALTSTIGIRRSTDRDARQKHMTFVRPVAMLAMYHRGASCDLARAIRAARTILVHLNFLQPHAVDFLARYHSSSAIFSSVRNCPQHIYPIKLK